MTVGDTPTPSFRVERGGDPEAVTVPAPARSSRTGRCSAETTVRVVGSSWGTGIIEILSYGSGSGVVDLKVPIASPLLDVFCTPDPTCIRLHRKRRGGGVGHPRFCSSYPAEMTVGRSRQWVTPLGSMPVLEVLGIGTDHRFVFGHPIAVAVHRQLPVRRSRPLGFGSNGPARGIGAGRGTSLDREPSLRPPPPRRSYRRNSASRRIRSEHVDRQTARCPGPPKSLIRSPPPVRLHQLDATCHRDRRAGTERPRIYR